MNVFLTSGSSSEIKKDGYLLDLVNIKEWLVCKNILDQENVLLSYKDVIAWYRSGAETYLSTFKINYTSGSRNIEKEIVIKAIISQPISKTLIKWDQRRRFLNNIGIKVSYWYWFGNGIIIEDFYPYDFSKTNKISELLNIASLLDKSGFKTLSFLNDIRCNEDGEIYYIDFGFDLGDPGDYLSDFSTKYLIKNIIKSKDYMYEILSENIYKSIIDAQNNLISYKDIYSDEINEGQNEFLFFIKPEITSFSKDIKLKEVIQLILEKIDEFGLSIKNVSILGGSYLKQHNIIAQHYGVINKISSNAKNELSENAKNEFKKLYGFPINECTYLGGGEFLDRYKMFNSLSLDYIWQNKINTKLSGGTYVTDVKMDDEIIYLINGFHPRQLEYFTDNGRSIVVFTLISDIDWKVARNEFIGSTRPSDAKHGSIRRELLDKKTELGLFDVSQGFNGVHLSAGPIEGLIELIRYNSNFLENGTIKNVDSFNFGKLLKSNFSDSNVQKILSNIDIDMDGKTVSIFDYTEEKNSNEVLSMLKGIL